VKQEFGIRTDFNTNELPGQHSTTSPAGLITTGDPTDSDEVQPLEHLCSIINPSHRSHPADRSLNAGADVHPMFHPSLVDFNNSLYQKPQQDLSYKGQPSLPMTGGSLQGCNNQGLNQAKDTKAYLQNTVKISTTLALSPCSHGPRLPRCFLFPTRQLLPKELDGPSTFSKSYRMSQGGERLNIKQEPQEDKELAFRSIGLQDITLDD
ncbi:hypothetical protein M9458_048812, partial [Cirrhinus mrigala]